MFASFAFAQPIGIFCLRLIGQFIGMTDPTKVVPVTQSKGNPWQLRWKRPELLRPNVSNDAGRGDCTNQPADDVGMVPISTASARLTEAEASEWLRPNRNRPNNPSADDDTACLEEGQHDEDSDVVLTVTILTSKQPAADDISVGDAVLLELTTTCDNASSSLSDPGNVKILHSKLLHWPSSALGGIEAIGVRTTRGGPGAGSKKKRKQKRRYVKQERGVQSVALCRRARSLPSGDGSTVGGTSSSMGGGDDAATFTTLQTTASTYEQMSDALDTLSLLTLVVGDRPSATQRRGTDLPSVSAPAAAATEIGDDRSHATKIDEVEPTTLVEIDTDGHLEEAPEEVKELVLCFLSDSGIVHFFDPRKLLFGGEATSKQKKSTGMNDDSSFASMLFGGDLLSKIDTTIAPLSEPAQTILISQFEHMPSIIEEEGDPSDDLEKASMASEFKALSLFDCTIEASSFHNVTVRNRPTICTTSFGYVAIAGKGTRRIGRKRRRLSINKADANSPRQGVVQNESGDEEEPLATEREQTKERWEWEYDYVPGGFVTFISLEHYAVSRTVFLSFEPKSMHPIIWNDMQFLVVLGGDNDIHQHQWKDGGVALPSAVAICVDSRRHIRLADKDPTPFRRFVPFAIDLSTTAPPEEDSLSVAVPTPISVTSMLTSPPSIISAAVKQDGSALMVYLHTITEIDFAERFPIRSQIFDRRFAAVPLPSFSGKAKPELWCISGQGWSMLCVQASDASCAAYFITWEGATAHSGAHVMRIYDFPVTFPSNIVSANVLPTTGSRRVRRDLVASGMSSPLSDRHTSRSTPVKKVLEDRATVESTTAAVLDCTELDIGANQEAMLHQQFVLANIRFGSGSNDQANFFLSLRKLAVKHGLATTPCNYILSWLSRGTDDDGVDYYTAASIALTLLQDDDAVRDLSSWDVFEGNDVGGGKERCLEGMLDGIVPVGEKTTDYAHSFSVESLADMAVACMVMGGAGMSTALEGFLGRNGDYDANRSCLMLAATASSSIGVKSDSEATKILWPIRCLLKIGLARNCMSTALALLNTSIPDALRCRAAKSSGVNGPLLHLSKAIVTMILASDPPLSAGCLLDLTETPNEHDSSARYWQSLDHDTRIAFSTIAVGSHHPLLRETQVRSWALDRITGYFESSLMQREDLAHSETMTKKDAHSLPSEWMVEMCCAILSNAGYRVEAVTAEFTYTNTDAETEENKANPEVGGARLVEIPGAPPSGGIDFNLLILALLSLDQRPLRLNDGSQVSAHHVLVSVCDLAGRRTHREPDFAFDASKAIKQCARAENVPAVAALIGGADGFVLKAAYVLIQSLNLSMKQAELLLREGIFSGEALESGVAEAGGTFTMTRGHRQLLSLFEEYVLSVRSLGQIDCDPMKGQIDPVFATRVLLRAWQALQQGQTTNITKEDDSSWLETWFRLKLGLNNDSGTGSNNDSTSSGLNRTACAAVLSRAMLWPDEELARALGFSCRFLTEVAKLCCGFVESVPPTVLFVEQ